MNIRDCYPAYSSYLFTAVKMAMWAFAFYVGFNEHVSGEPLLNFWFSWWCSR